jgi:hypothetical protein
LVCAQQLMDIVPRLDLWLMRHENLFEKAVRWYRLDKKRPERTAPSSLRRKLDQISKSAHRLLKSLAVNSPNDAADGPGNPENSRHPGLDGRAQ